MRYSVITKSVHSDTDEPFLFENDAIKHFAELVESYSASNTEHDKTAFFIVDNITNRIIVSYDFFVSCTPVEFHEIKEVSSSTVQMINNLHDLIELKNLTLTMIALKTGMSVSNVCRFFKAKSNPTLNTYVAISNAINMM